MDAIRAYQEQAARKSDFERTEIVKDKTGVRVEGVNGINPVTGKEIPIFISDYVLMTYGTGAIMAVPAHDTRDYDFAKAFDLPIIEVVKGGDVTKEAFTDCETGIMVNSGILDGLDGRRSKEEDYCAFWKRPGRDVQRSTLSCATGCSPVRDTGENRSRWFTVKNAAGFLCRKANFR